MKRIVCLFLCILLAVSLCACQPDGGMTDAEKIAKWGANYRPDLEKPNRENLYGLCCIPQYDDYPNVRNYYKDVYQVLDNMGVTFVRHWLHFGYVMTDPWTLREEQVRRHHEMLAEAKAHGFEILGLNHMNYIEGKGFDTGKHRYQPWEGSDYYAWLDDYEESWFTLVKEFPEITYWEIDSEFNNPEWMYIRGELGEYMPVDDMLQITVDMLYRASCGIHRANPDAVAVMGALTEPPGIGKAYSVAYEGIGRVRYPTNAEFLEMMYQEIASGEHGSTFPDDFFQVACWHPYYWFSSAADQYWIDENNELYDIILKHEGKDKKVFLSEIGWRIRPEVSEEQQAKWVEELYQTVREKLPYVETVCYFRTFDNLIDNQQMFGLFYDPHEGRSYDHRPDTGGAAGAPRPSAYAYQKVAGGTGSLTILTED